MFQNVGVIKVGKLFYASFFCKVTHTSCQSNLLTTSSISSRKLTYPKSYTENFYKKSAFEEY